MGMNTMFVRFNTPNERVGNERVKAPVRGRERATSQLYVKGAKILQEAILIAIHAV